MALADTHCHLYLSHFQQDLPEVLQRAWEHGLVRILAPGIDLETSRQAVALAEGHPNLFAAVGVHPNNALSWSADSLAELRDLAQHPKVVAMGEIGLDYYRERSPRSLQQDIFRRQLELAAGLQLPVIIHSRQAIEDLWATLLAWQEDLQRAGLALAGRPGVLHSYESTLEIAREAVDRHFLIGVSGPVTFRNAPERQRVIQNLPVESLLLETDAPYLAPHPHRGQRNEPAYVALIAEKVAELHQLPVSSIGTLTTRNADQLFAWGAVV